NELVLSAPLTRMVISDDGEPVESQTRVSIGSNGIQVFDEPAPGADDADPDARADQRSRVLRGAEAVAERKIQITTELD
ncbi:hypothetical protein FPK47_31640, partial [Acinetobacter baumannii]|nr:hypothetical protein [Acinetobacter baumannii]